MANVNISLGRIACGKLWKGSNAPQALTDGGSPKSLTDLFSNVSIPFSPLKLFLISIHVLSLPSSVKSMYVCVCVPHMTKFVQSTLTQTFVWIVDQRGNQIFVRTANTHILGVLGALKDENIGNKRYHATLLHEA